MQVRASLISLTSRALYESIQVDIMVKIVRNVLPDYDLYKRTGIRESIPIMPRDAADRIVKDCVEFGLFLAFVESLIQVDKNGIMGRQYPISSLPKIIKEVAADGYLYDAYNGIFVEDAKVKRTPHWGRLVDGRDYRLAFLRLDIVNNSVLVRKYPQDLIEATYADLRDMVQNLTDKRWGRIWTWEGDGGLLAFNFYNPNLQAALTGMEIIHQLFLYNRMKCRLKEPLQVRLAVHNGLVKYSAKDSEIRKNDVIRKVIEIESKDTENQSLTLSNSTEASLDKIILSRFVAFPSKEGLTYYRYKIRWEDK